MSLVKWDKSFSVGVREMDEQHVVLIDLINTFYDRIGKGERKENFSTLLQGLKEYAEMHFIVEEDYMLLFGFDGYQEHKNEHDKFLEKVEEFEAKLMQGELLLSYDVLSFLSLWLVDHMKGVDKKYTDIFLANGLDRVS